MLEFREVKYPFIILKMIYKTLLEKPLAFFSCVGLFFFVMKANTYTAKLFTENFSSLTAPLIEESFRLLSIYMGGYVSLWFSPVMAVMEFFLYINREHTLTQAFVAMRMVAIGLHMTCFYIQYTLYKKYLTTGLNTYIWIGLLGAILLHLNYNSFIAYLIAKFVYALYQ